MATPFERRLRLAESALSPATARLRTIYITGGLPYDANQPFIASAVPDRGWTSARGETFEAFKTRVASEAVGVTALIFGGLPIP